VQYILKEICKYQALIWKLMLLHIII